MHGPAYLVVVGRRISAPAQTLRILVDTLQWENTGGLVDGQAFMLLGVITSGSPHAYLHKCMHGAKGWLAPMWIPYHVVFVSVELQSVEPTAKAARSRQWGADER